MATIRVKTRVTITGFVLELGLVLDLGVRLGLG